MDPFAIDTAACRSRGRRLLEATAPLAADLVLLTRRESVQWLTGAHVRHPFEPIAAMTADGHVTLILPERQLDDALAADELIGYDAKWHSTTRDDQRAASSAVLRDVISNLPKRAACEFSTFCPHHFLAWNCSFVNIDATLFDLRRRKDPDELAMLRQANEANRAMYHRAREIIEPGVNELDVYAELYAVAVGTLGEPPTYFGQDFRSAARGGAPRNRTAQAGELYILDLGVGFRGYHSDNCRTLSVDGAPTDAQQCAWQTAADSFPLVESRIRPGASCRQLYLEVEELLNQHRPWTFNHHLGHGVGLAPQEGPHINPRWDDTFAEGDFIAIEPGQYHDDLRAGVRLEQNYRVTAAGVELLTDWPLQL